MLESLTLENFAPRIGERFRVTAGDGKTMDVTLMEATALGAASRPPSAGRAPFSLVFLGAVRPVWMQSTYRVEHDAIGSFDLFLVPIGPRDGAMQYEAVFT